jgi:single-stranded-DNA-specific exonuclease
MEKLWTLLRPDSAAVAALTASLACHPVVAAVLANRRILTPREAHAFLNPSLQHLRSPAGLKDVNTAVERIARAVTTREPILVFGDYDVDGMTATCVLLEFLNACGARVSYYIPSRLREGYGLQPRHIAEVAAPSGARLVITADCGSGSHAAVTAATAAGIDVVVTDHHHPGGVLPEALAVVNPKRADCRSGMSQLAGVGVAFCLVIALRAHLRDSGFWSGRREPNLKALCDLVALGTIADMVPLQQENRILASVGLQLIASGRRPGLAALLEVAGIADRPVDSDDVAFRLGPRLNAAGRVDDAALGIELLAADRLDSARQIAHTLDGLNTRRRELEQTILEEIDARTRKEPSLLAGRTLVLAAAHWHPGVIGIVASRLMDRQVRPVVLIALEDGCGRGSARSPAGMDLFACLSACRPLLEELGGHAQAAGLRILEANIPAFREAFEAAVTLRHAPDAFIRKLEIDAELDFDGISEDLLNQLERLMPFGSGNPEPIFMAQDVTVLSAKWVGGNHRQMLLRQGGGSGSRSLRAIEFHGDPGSAHPLRFQRLAYRLRWNRWNSSRTIQILVEDGAPAEF